MANTDFPTAMVAIKCPLDKDRYEAVGVDVGRGEFEIVANQ